LSRLVGLPVLHAGGVDPTGPLWSDWNVEPTIVIGLLAMVAGYLFLVRRRESLVPTLTTQPALPPTQETERIESKDRSLPDSPGVGHTAAFVAGALVIFIALGPPLDDWSDHYLLSAHMVQHLLLVLLAAPLLLYGTPAWLLEPLTRNRITNTIGYWLTRPVVAYALANAVFVLWHVPMFYDEALRSQPVHVFEHMTLLGTALLAWWPVLGPLPQWPRLPLPLHSLYYFAMTLPGTVVGAFITFADPGLYSPYDTARRIFGIDLATDQQAAGLLMWVAVSAIYLLLLTVSFFRWAARDGDSDSAMENELSVAQREPSSRPTG
jgi:putative membrane protein